MVQLDNGQCFETKANSSSSLAEVWIRVVVLLYLFHVKLLLHKSSDEFFVCDCF